jgi:hypothetical protein
MMALDRSRRVAGAVRDDPFQVIVIDDLAVTSSMASHVLAS